MAVPSPDPSDLSDARWQLIEPVLAAWRACRQATALGLGRRPEHDLRSVMNAIVYVDRTSRRLALPATRLPTLADGLRVLRRLAR